MQSKLNFTSLQSNIKHRVISFLQSNGLIHWITPKVNSLSHWNSQNMTDSKMDSERCVEIPWVASAISQSVGLWLDIGHAHAESRYWEAIDTRCWKKLIRYGYGIDLVFPKVTNPLARYYTADLTLESLTPLPRFNLITCISTLEHMGCDNKIYLSTAQRMNEPWKIQKKVFSNMLSQCDRNGRLFLSVPYGKKADYGWFLQYDEPMINELIALCQSLEARLISERYFRLETNGWVESAKHLMNDVEYRSSEHRAAGVALIEMTKL